MNSKLEPAISSRDTGQQISWYDSFQLNIVCMSDMKDICCNPLRTAWLGISRMAAMLCHVVRRRRRWAHAPVIHAASHFYHKKRVAWVPISMHTCGSFFYNYGAPLKITISEKKKNSQVWKKGKICIKILTKEA